jgi:hypothetical protein
MQVVRKLISSIHATVGETSGLHALPLAANQFVSVIAFHKKAGRSKASSSFFFARCFALPSGHCRHASIRTLKERIVRSVHLGVLGSVGAAT